jgi:hypothetical protein
MSPMWICCSFIGPLLPPVSNVFPHPINATVPDITCTYCAEPIDVVCDMSQPASYNATTCRLNTWRALVDLFNAGQARAIGVSNYNATHIQEIIDAGLPLPSVNQIPYVDILLVVLLFSTSLPLSFTRCHLQVPLVPLLVAERND